MNVIIANDFGSVVGGASHVAITEALGLANRGHEVTYFYSIGPLDPKIAQHKRIQAISAGEYDLLTDPNRIRAGLKGIWNEQACRKLNEILNDLKGQGTIVHLHGWNRSLSPMIGRPIQRHNFPLVYTLHDYFIACPNGGYFNYQKNDACPLKSLSIACLVEHCDPNYYAHKLWRYFRTSVQRYVAGLPNPEMDFIAVSDFSLNILKPYLPETAPIHKLPNPIQVPHDPPIQVSANEQYVFIGRLSTYKGPKILAQANQNRDFSLTFVGEGELSDTIRSMDESAKITGWLDKEDVIKHIDGSRALIFPSRGYETQGLVVLEAASRGVPAVVSDSCAATEFVEDGVTGFWFRNGDADDLHEKMMLLEDDDTLTRLGAEAYRRYWENPFLAERHIDGLLSIYNEILHRP